MLKAEYSDFLATLGPDRRAHMVVIGFDVEQDSLRKVSIDRTSEFVLGQIPMVLLKSADARKTNSLREVLDLARRQKTRLSQPDPTQHSSGLAALALEAYAAHILSSDGQKIDSAAMQRLLGWLPSAANTENLEDKIGFQNTDVAVVSQDQCATIMHEQPGFHGSYPVEGTLEISYRAYLAADLSDEEKTAAQQFLSFMQSSDMEQLKKDYAIGKECVGSTPQSVFATPSVTALRILLQSWKESVRKTDAK